MQGWSAGCIGGWREEGEQGSIAASFFGCGSEEDCVVAQWSDDSFISRRQHSNSAFYIVPSAPRRFFFNMRWRGTGTVASDSGTSMVVGRSVICRRGGPLQHRALDTYGSGDVYSFHHALALVLFATPA